MKDSTVVKGKIIEQKFQEYIKVKTKGEILTLNINDINKIVKIKSIKYHKTENFFQASWGIGLEYYLFGGKIQYYPKRNIGFSFGLGIGLFEEIGVSGEVNYHFYPKDVTKTPKVVPTLGFSITHSLGYNDNFVGIRKGIEINLKNTNILSIGITSIFLEFWKTTEGNYNSYFLYTPIPSIGYTHQIF